MNHDPSAVRRKLLVVRCQRGDREACVELVQYWEPRLFVYIRKLAPDEESTWQILQETWLQVLKGIATLRDPGRFPAWVYQIARNMTMTQHRLNYARPHPIQDDVPADDCEHLSFENAELVHYGLAQLPIQDRELLTLFFLDDLHIGEIADMLEIPSGTVKSRLFRAKRMLRDILEREGGRHV